jgi:chlorobactene glucosyltransferase
MLGMGFILAYLWSTERKAPSIRQPLAGDKAQETTSTEFPLISVIITAKNEGQVIEKCVSSIRNQTYQNIEIIVVDDSSVDHTRDIVLNIVALDARVHLIEAGPKPNGWLGKSWPCQKGFEASRGDILLFVDADSIFDSAAIDLTRSRLENAKFDMYSISPRIALKGIWAHAVVPLLSSTINLLYPMVKVNDPSSERAYVFGTFIMVRRSVYQAIGGHERVKDTLVEDAAIAQKAKSMGYRLRVEKGDGLIETEWEEEFSAIYQGMERIFSESIRSYGPLSVLNAVLIFFLGLYPIVFVIASVYLLATTPLSLGPLLVLSIGFAASIADVAMILTVASFELRNLTGRISIYPLVYPLGFFLYMCAIITTARKVFSSKSLAWKGEKYIHSGRANQQ